MSESTRQRIERLSDRDTRAGGVEALNALAEGRLIPADEWTGDLPPHVRTLLAKIAGYAIMHTDPGKHLQSLGRQAEDILGPPWTEQPSAAARRQNGDDDNAT